MSNPHRFSDKVAFVTGAASGIGRATAVAFGSEGARVAILDLSENDLSETAEAVRNAGAEVLTIACDVSKPEQVEAVNRRPKRTPYRRPKGTPFVERRDGYDGRFALVAA